MQSAESHATLNIRRLLPWDLNQKTKEDVSRDAYNDPETSHARLIPIREFE